MSSSDPNAHAEALPVTIELHLHWQCPHCQMTNTIRLPEELPKFVTCTKCQKVSRTLVNE